jgi:hypothetical protein
MNKLCLPLVTLLLGILNLTGQVVAKEIKIASDIHRIVNISPYFQQLIAGYGDFPMPASRCNENELLIGVEADITLINLENITLSAIYGDKGLIDFSTVRAICSPLKLNKKTLHFETVKPMKASNRITCEANQVVVGVNVWDSRDLYQNQDRPRTLSDTIIPLSAIQLECASLKLTGERWIGATEIKDTHILGHPTGEMIIQRHCSDPGLRAATGLLGLRQDINAWPNVDEKQQKLRLNYIAMECGSIFPQVIDGLADLDNDGINNRDEALLGVSFFHQDTDADGIIDAEEIHLDSDGDGKVNAIESAITDGDLDGIFDEYDLDDQNPCIPIADQTRCETYRQITLDPQGAHLPMIPLNAKNEQCYAGPKSRPTRLDYSCSIDGVYATTWRAHYNATSWGFYSFSWHASRRLGIFLGGYQSCFYRLFTDDCDLTSLVGRIFQKTVRNFQDGSKATGVWGGEIKTVLQRARPIAGLSSDYYTGDEQWEDYIGVMYFDNQNQLEAITLSKWGDDNGRTFVVDTDDNKRSLVVVDEGYIYNHSK